MAQGVVLPEDPTDEKQRTDLYAVDVQLSPKNRIAARRKQVVITVGTGMAVVTTWRGEGSHRDREPHQFVVPLPSEGVRHDLVVLRAEAHYRRIEPTYLFGEGKKPPKPAHDPNVAMDLPLAEVVVGADGTVKVNDRRVWYQDELRAEQRLSPAADEATAERAEEADAEDEADRLVDENGIERVPD